MKAEGQDVVGDEVPRPPVVEGHEVLVSSFGIGPDGSIEQHDGNAGAYVTLHGKLELRLLSLGFEV